MACGSRDHAPTSLGDASVHGGGQSVESDTTCRSTSSTQDREQLFKDIVARLSCAILVLDTSLSSSTTLPNMEKIIVM